MKKVLKVLASDFENNRFSNTNVENGCPIQRAFKRAEILKSNDPDDKESFYNTSSYWEQESVKRADSKVCGMFIGSEPTQDFIFEVEL